MGRCVSAELCIVKTSRRTLHFLEIAGLEIAGFAVDGLTRALRNY